MANIKRILKKLLGEARFGRMKHGRLFRIGISVVGTLKAADLLFLAKFFNTDKERSHSYTRHYEEHFKALRKQKLNILEIGVGGHKNPEAGGASLRMWKYYFPHSTIYGIDLYDKRRVEESRIRVFQGSQADGEFLRRVVNDIGPLHIVIDDGSHIESDIIASFKTLFPLIAPGGIYVVEDVTMLDFFKQLPETMHYYDTLLFIYKRGSLVQS